MQTLEDAPIAYRLRSSAMGTTLGERLIAALIPARVKNKSKLAQLIGAAGSTVHNWSTGKSTPDTRSIELIAEKLGIDVADLLREVEGPRVEPESHSRYSEGEAPFNFNLPNWDSLVSTALALDEARAVPACFVELVAYDNGLLTGPLRPADILKTAKFTMQFRTVEEAEAKLIEMRARFGRPPLRRDGEAQSRTNKG